MDGHKKRYRSTGIRLISLLVCLLGGSQRIFQKKKKYIYSKIDNDDTRLQRNDQPDRFPKTLINNVPTYACIPPETYERVRLSGLVSHGRLENTGNETTNVEIRFGPG